MTRTVRRPRRRSPVSRPAVLDRRGQVWERIVQVRPKTDSQGRHIFSQKYYKAFDCTERLSRSLQSIDYADRDSTAVVGELTYYPASWPYNAASPGSAEDKLISYVCNTAAAKLRTGR